jgi:hypothetical protein
VGLVEDDEVPLAVFEEEVLVLRPLEAVDGGDGQGPVAPDARVDRQEVAAEDLERRAELVLQLFLPLRGEAGGGDDEGAFGLAALGERLPDHAGLDGFAESDLVGQEEAAPRAGDDAVGGEDLVRQDLGAGVAELTALVAGQEPRRLHLQLEAPRLFPLAARRPLQRRLHALQFGEVEKLVFGAVRRRHEDGGVELHLGQVVAHLDGAADAIGLVNGVRAADQGAFGEGAD